MTVDSSPGRDVTMPDRQFYYMEQCGGRWYQISRDQAETAMRDPDSHPENLYNHIEIAEVSNGTACTARAGVYPKRARAGEACIRAGGESAEPHTPEEAEVFLRVYQEALRLAALTDRDEHQHGTAGRRAETTRTPDLEGHRTARD